MTESEIHKRIQQIREKSQQKRKKTVAKLRHFSNRIRSKLLENFPLIKSAALIGAIAFSANATPNLSAEPNISRPNTSALTTQPPKQTSSPVDTINVGDQVAKDISSFVSNMNHCIDMTQNNIRIAKGKGCKAREVKKLFDYVCPDLHIGGGANYCVAGALFVHKQCNDNVMNSILPSEKDGSARSSCIELQRYFQRTLGQRYAAKGSRNFNQVCQSLKEGDIIIVYSNQNTSSGRHCLTVAAPPRNGQVKVRSFNNESNYQVSFGQIACAANIMDEYQDRLTRYYNQENVQILAAAQTKSATNNAQETIPQTSYASNTSSYQDLPAFLQTPDIDKNEPLPAILLQKNSNTL